MAMAPIIANAARHKRPHNFAVCRSNCSCLVLSISAICALNASCRSRTNCSALYILRDDERKKRGGATRHRRAARTAGTAGPKGTHHETHYRGGYCSGGVCTDNTGARTNHCRVRVRRAQRRMWRLGARNRLRFQGWLCIVVVGLSIGRK
jgi:hypothetical protein